MQFCMKLTVLQRSPPEMEIYYNERYLTALGAAPRCKKDLILWKGWIEAYDSFILSFPTRP